MSTEDLERAIRSGDLETVRRLVEEEGLDVNTRFNFNFTALQLASISGNVELVQFLLDSDAEVNARDGDGETVLHRACRRAGNIRVIQLLVDYKADVNGRAKSGSTALHYAVAYCAGLDVVRYLLGHKASVNGKDVHGNAALHCALGDIETVQCLLDHDADVNIADTCGRTPLHGTRYKRISAPVAELLLSHGAKSHAKDEQRQTPLHVWAADDSVEAVRVLLDHLSSSNDPAATESALMCRTNIGRLPFHMARSLEMAQVLLEQPLLEDEDQVVPRACHAMLSTHPEWEEGGESPLCKYLASFKDLPLTDPAPSTYVPSCEHRDKRRRRRHATAPFNPNLNEFQRCIAKVFLNKWDQSFRQRGGTTASSGADDHDDVHAMLPDDLKYTIMAYLTPADIMKI